MSKLFLESTCTPGTEERKTIISDKVTRINKVQVGYIKLTIDINMFKSLDTAIAKDMLYEHFKKHLEF